MITFIDAFVSNNTQYVFKPRDEVADWIDENVESWTGFCYNAIYQKQRKAYQQRFEMIGIRIFIILIGMILVSFSYVSINIWNYLMLISGGVVVIIFGFIMLSLEIKNGRRGKL